MDTPRAKTPVFTDESGKRVIVLQWVARGLCACVVMVGVALAVTLVTHVPLPGLGGHLTPPTTERAPRAAPEAMADDERALGAGPNAGSAQRDASAAKARSMPSGAAAATRHGVAASKTRPSPSAVSALQAQSSGATAPQAQATRAAAPQAQAPGAAAPASAATTHQPRAQATANPHATAKSANSTVRATPQASRRTENSRASAGRINGQPRHGPTSTPPGSTK